LPSHLYSEFFAALWLWLLVNLGCLALIVAATAPQAARQALRESVVDFDPLLDWMRSANVPITRDTYIALSWGANVPDPWMPEDEAELPSFLREEDPHPVRADRRRRPPDR